MRLLTKWQKSNANATGGGPTTPQPAEITMEATGPLLEVFANFGHLMTGRVPFDSDGLRENVAAAASMETGDGGLENSGEQQNNAEKENGGDSDKENGGNAENGNGGEQLITFDLPSCSQAIRNAPISPANVVPLPQPSTSRRTPKQYFATSAQRRRVPAKQMATATSSSDSNNMIQEKQIDFWEKRCQYIDNQERRANEYHCMRMQYRQRIYEQQMAFWAAAIHRQGATIVPITDVGNVHIIDADNVQNPDAGSVQIIDGNNVPLIDEDNVQNIDADNGHVSAVRTGPVKAHVHPFNWNVRNTPPTPVEVDAQNAAPYDEIDYLESSESEVDDENDEDYVPA